MTGPALAAIAESNRLGITLAVLDGKLRFQPRDKMTPDLLQRLRANKPDVLAVLAASATPDPDPWPDGRPGWVDQVMDGPTAKDDRPGATGSTGYRRHLTRIKGAAKANQLETKGLT